MLEISTEGFRVFEDAILEWNKISGFKSTPPQ